MRFLLDTNAGSEPIRESPDPAFTRWLEAQEPDDLAISALTCGELRRGVALLPEGRRRLRLEAALLAGVAHFADRILPIDASVASTWADLSARLRGAGCPVAPIDQRIAATALTHGLIVVTRNVRDFEPMGCEVVRPWASSP